MTDTPRPAPLAPDTAARLAAFARACKGAARVVALYPPEHPAIESALARLAEAAAAATRGGTLSLLVSPDNLLVDGRSSPRPDPAITDLASLLHQHLVGELTIQPAMDTLSWRIFLGILAIDRDEVRAQGGIARAWATAGGRGLDLHEIDYASLVQERDSGDRASWDAIIANCLRVDAMDLDEETLNLLADIASDATRLSDFVGRIEEQRASHADAQSRAKALLRVLTQLIAHLDRTDPVAVDRVFQNMAAAATRLSPEVMMELLALGRTKGDAEERVVGQIARRVTDPMLARFVSRSVIAERGCTERLAEAFRTLAPSPERQRTVMGLARDIAEASPLGTDKAFEQIWSHVEQLLVSYSDTPFVSEAYNQELSGVRARALEIENLTDDPPERIAAWLTTVSDKALRTLDLWLLRDMLLIESDFERWRDIAALSVEHVNDLLLIGDFRSAAELVRTLAAVGARSRHAGQQATVAHSLDMIVNGQMMSLIATHLTTVGDPDVEEVRQLLTAIGPSLIPRLADTLANEERPRARQRLTQLLISFGEHGRHSVDQLRKSPSASVRRTAVQLLRSFGGREALGEIAEMLEDREANVQREAVRALIGIGTNEAYEVLEQALSSETSRARSALMQELGATRDERATPLLCFIVVNMECRGHLREVYLKALARLGVLGGPESVDALKQALAKGQWWAPWRWREVWNEAAASLVKVNTAEALQALGEAASSGPLGARRVAKRHLKSAGVS